VNSAGIAQYKLLAQSSSDHIRTILDINLLGTIYACKKLSRLMIASRKEGVLINISSALAYRYGAGSSVYAASKAGVIGFSKALAEELGPRIRVNTLVPGYISTDMTSGMSESLEKMAKGKIASKRFGRVEEVAQAAHFLATCEYANGSSLILDGGTIFE
jgi:NAD(P)-dependent dehydrogenase (short-subunit alcohol dehydrogenase family)